MLEESAGYNTMGVQKQATIEDGVEFYPREYTPEEKLIRWSIVHAAIDLWNHRKDIAEGVYSDDRLKKESVLKRFEKSRNRHDAAKYWFSVLGNDGPYSFEYCCLFLNKDSKRLREYILSGPPKDFKIDWKKYA